MPTLKENIDYWEKHYPWDDGGHEWSNPWGDPNTQWYGSILIRIQEYLPVNRLLEIAPGYGRWTEFLHQHCSTLQAVDVSGNCIDYCRNKFLPLKKISFYQNNGKSLEMIQDNSIDFVFSFDSFVHFNHQITNCYIKEISSKLKTGGNGFIHHSNIGCHCNYIINKGWRSNDVSHTDFEETCRQHGLYCITQELITWVDNKETLTDCFSLFTKSKKKITTKVIKNFSFIDEIELLRNIGNMIKI
jgi:SAM-dependent methyltransferase